MEARTGDDHFREQLVAHIPYMRAFARSLCRDPSAADDLAQEALLRAWNRRDSFAPGTNMKAWLFKILRNHFYTEARRAWRQQTLDPRVAESTLMAADAPEATLELDHVRRALAQLPDEQREALILVGAGRLSYEEAADALDCAVGTVKSRVSRARIRLAGILRDGAFEADGVRPSSAMAAIMDQFEDLRSARAA